MSALYPPKVDQRNTTIGGLWSHPRFVKMRAMASTTEAPQFEDIGRRLQAIRCAESRLSQRDWAEQHGFGASQWNNWEKGIRRITVDEADRLCALYGLTLDFIYRGNLSGISENIKNRL